MTETPLRLPLYLRHILQSIARIQTYTSNLSQAAFVADTLLQDAVIRNLEVIGEACRNIERRYPEIASAHPDVAWGDAWRMRNSLGHAYFKIDLDTVWRTIQNDLPPMTERIPALLGSLSDTTPRPPNPPP
jgi:uncharacterized protein with HEPN domain